MLVIFCMFSIFHISLFHRSLNPPQVSFPHVSTMRVSTSFKCLSRSFAFSFALTVGRRRRCGNKDSFWSFLQCYVHLFFSRSSNIERNNLSKKWRKKWKNMKPILMLFAFLPHMIVSQTEKEKYQEIMTPSQSLYCNDLNPQTHLDFNMVKKLETNYYC